MTNPTASTTASPTPAAADAHRRRILATIARKSFCVLASTSPAGRPHAAGVVYDHHDGSLWLHTKTDSRKAKNVAANPWVGVTIPFRRLPLGPPFTIHFQARAELVALDAPEAVAALDTGDLDGISGHGALDMPDSCFVRIQPQGSIHSYGPGARTIDLIRDPLNHGAASFPLDAEAGRS